MAGRPVGRPEAAGSAWNTRRTGGGHCRVFVVRATRCSPRSNTSPASSATLHARWPGAPARYRNGAPEPPEPVSDLPLGVMARHRRHVLSRVFSEPVAQGRIVIDACHVRVSAWTVHCATGRVTRDGEPVEPVIAPPPSSPPPRAAPWAALRRSAAAADRRRRRGVARPSLRAGRRRHRAACCRCTSCAFICRYAPRSTSCSCCGYCSVASNQRARRWSIGLSSVARYVSIAR